MLSSVGWAALGVGFIFLMTSLGAASVLFCREDTLPKSQTGMMGFAGGVMTAASVWSMLLPAIEQTRSAGTLPCWLPAAAGTAAGAALSLHARCADPPPAPRRLRRKKLHADDGHYPAQYPRGDGGGARFRTLGRSGRPDCCRSARARHRRAEYPGGRGCVAPAAQAGYEPGQGVFNGACSPGAVEPLFGMARRHGCPPASAG